MSVPPIKQSSSPRERLKRFRDHVQASQRDLANVFGVTPGAIAMWESGQRELNGLGLALLERLESDFGLSEAPTDPALESHHLSQLFTEKLVANIQSTSANGRNEKSDHQKPVREMLRELIDSHLSTVSGTRRLQVSLVERILDHLADAKGLPLKVLQLASFIDFGMSHESQQLLIHLQNSLSPMHPRQLKDVFQEEFGRQPLDLFATWEPSPFAIASIGQVHRAQLKTGEVVAVKVQYPNVHRNMTLHSQPIRLLSALVALVRNDYSDMLSDFVRRLRDECDYKNEARMQHLFYNAFASDPQIVIPKVFDEFSGSRVLTTEYIEGQDLRTFAKVAAQEKRNTVGGIIHRFNQQSAMNFGLLQADNHPGNYLILDGKVAFLDFGRSFQMSAEEVRKMKTFYSTVYRNDKDAAKAAMIESGYVRKWKDFDFENFWTVLRTQMSYELSQTPVHFDKDYVQKIWLMSNSFRQRGYLTMNSHFFWPIFSSAGLWSILAELEATYTWRNNLTHQP